MTYSIPGWVADAILCLSVAAIVLGCAYACRRRPTVPPPPRHPQHAALRIVPPPYDWDRADNERGGR